jgi:predicted ATPase
MINSITLKNFKCYDTSTNFQLRRLNLLTGINGKGKSTFLQSLLLFAQSPIPKEKEQGRLFLNGKFVNLGTFDDVRNAHTSRTLPIEFSFGLDGTIYIINLMQGNDERILQINKPLSVNKPEVYLQKTHYVAADRLGPQEFYPKMDMEYLHVGKKGEFVAQALAKAQTEQITVSPALVRGNNAASVSVQASEWIANILGNRNFAVMVNAENRSVIELTFKMGSTVHNMLNVGFGYSYILPIIVAGLIVRPGEVLIVENPEAHLHPRAQSQLAYFLAEVAQTGVQVFIESHSDHILNALRVSARKGTLAPRDIQVFYFDENPNGNAPLVFTPQIDADGRIDNWPDGFFDEWDNNLMELL